MGSDAFFPAAVNLAVPVNQIKPSYCTLSAAYLWVACSATAGSRKLFRIRLSDDVIVGTDGLDKNPGDANSYYTISAVTGWDITGCIYWPETNEVLVPCEQYVHCFDATTMALNASIDLGTSPTKKLIESACRVGSTLYCTTNPNNGGVCFTYTVDVVARTSALLAQINGTGGFNSTHITCLSYDGVDLWASDGNRSNSIYRISTATGTCTQAVVISGVASSGNFTATDGTYVFSQTNTGRWTTIRCSDGAWMKPDKTVGAAYTDAQTAPWTAATVTGLMTAFDDLYVGSSPGGVGRWERYRISDYALGGVFPKIGGWPVSGVNVGNRWYSINNLGTGTTQDPHVNHMDIVGAPTTSTVPNLTAVTPGTGPHLSLTFDNPVGITGPTIGAASSGLGVTGATAISATQIDLACAIRPDHPNGEATSATLTPPIGEADNLGPPVPTGVGATIV